MCSVENYAVYSAEMAPQHQLNMSVTTVKNTFSYKNGAGFTLIEMMITIAIVGILAAVAVPSYRSYVVRTKRADAMGALESAAAALTKYRSNNNLSYAGAGLTGCAKCTAIFTNQVPVEGGTKHYSLVLSNLTASGYTLTANPEGSQSGDGTLTLNEKGERTWAAKTCWPSSSTC